MFYLFHIRSCASPAAGASRTSSCPLACATVYAPWPQAPATLGAVLDCVHSALSVLPPLLVRGPLHIPPLLGSLCLAQGVHVILGPLLQGPAHPALILAAACIGQPPLGFLCWGAVVHGGAAQRTAACLCMHAVASNVHFRQPFCEALTAAFTVALSPAGYSSLPPEVALASHAVLVARAIAAPAFPAGQAAPAQQPAPAAAPPPPEPHAEPRPPGGRDLRATAWAVSVMKSRRGALCRAPACREALAKGDLRVCNPDLANPLYYHPACVEGGLGPYDQVRGTEALSPEQQNAVRGHCDRPGRPTRAEYVADHGRAKRARTDPDTARQAAALGVPLLEEDDGALGPEPGDPSSSMPPQPANLQWWDTVDYDALERYVPTILQVPANVSAALAQLRGRVAEQLLAAKAAGDAAAQARAEKAFTFFDRVMLFTPGKTRGGQKAHNSGGLTRILTRR